MHPQSTAVQLPLFVFDKRCHKCSAIKPLVDFYRQSAAADGHHRWCKACCEEHQRARHARLDAEGRTYAAVTTKRCSRCGERKDAAAFARNRRTRDGLFALCVSCSRSASQAYHAANEERDDAYQQAYYAAHTAECLARAHAYRATHKDYYRDLKRAWVQVETNRERKRAWERAWREAHPGYYAAQGRRRYRANPLAYYVWAANRRARKRGAPGHWTKTDLRALEAAQAGQCYYCAAPYGRYHMDHKTPLIRGGTNWPDNLALTCARCNLRKHTKTEAEFRAWLACGP